MFHMTHSWSISMSYISMKLSWVNHQYKRLPTMWESRISLIKSWRYKPKTLRENVNMTPKVDFGKKYPITYILFLCTANSIKYRISVQGLIMLSFVQTQNCDTIVDVIKSFLFVQFVFCTFPLKVCACKHHIFFYILMGNFTFQIWKTFNVQAGICFHYVNSRSCLLLGWWAAQAAFPWRLACLVKGAAGNWLAAKACTMYHSTVCVARKQQKRQSVFNKMDKIWHYTETAGLSNSRQKFTECKRENKIFVCEDQESRHRPHQD